MLQVIIFTLCKDSVYLGAWCSISRRAGNTPRTCADGDALEGEARLYKTERLNVVPRKPCIATFDVAWWGSIYSVDGWVPSCRAGCLRNWTRSGSCPSLMR